MTTSLTMVEADLSSAQLQDFLAAHLAEMAPSVPGSSQHALGSEDFLDPDVRLWEARMDGSLAGTVALRRIGARQVEVKTMRIAPAFRGRGLARELLEFVLDKAREGHERTVFLETGVADLFVPARGLYASAGFVRCGPYGEYGPDPLSVFMRLDLDAAPAF